MEVQVSNLQWIGLILVFIAVSTFITIVLYFYRKEKSKISFKEGLDLTGLPIVSFNCESKKLHFLLDTGSNISFINNSILPEIPHTPLNEVSNTIGVGGEGLQTIHYKIPIWYKDLTFDEEFGAVDLSGAFKSIEDETGIKLHGILGNKFFEKYKYILDFKDLIAYR